MKNAVKKLASAIALSSVFAIGPVSGALADGDDRRAAAQERREDRQAEAQARRSIGLSSRAKRELRAAGVDKYLNKFRPVSSEPFAQDWIKHTFDSDDGDGPVCIGGTDYSVFTKEGSSDRLIIFLQGGGACWEGLEACNTTAEAQFPPPAAFLPGVFAQSSRSGEIDNPLGDASLIYMPYCDGSVFIGDNDVSDDPTFGVRRHRGLRNLSAGMTVARKMFRRPKQILVAGTSAGGVGATSFAPFLARILYGNRVDLAVFNDAGPVALDIDLAPDAAQARADDWQFAKFYPESCVEAGLCDPLGQATGLIEWRLGNDTTIREAFYETDADQTNIGFASVNLPGNPPFVPVNQFDYRLVLDEAYGGLNAAFPDRYKRFIVSGGNRLCNGFVAYSHTALQSPSLANLGCPEVDLYYDLVSDGTSLWRWTTDFVENNDDWRDIVEPFAIAPIPMN